MLTRYMPYQRLDISKNPRTFPLSHTENTPIARRLHGLLLRVALRQEYPLIPYPITRSVDIRIERVGLLRTEHLAIKSARLAQPHFAVYGETIRLIERREPLFGVFADRPRRLAEPPVVVVFVWPAQHGAGRQSEAGRGRGFVSEGGEAAVVLGLVLFVDRGAVVWHDGPVTWARGCGSGGAGVREGEGGGARAVR